jgi:hypothetical protein
VNTAGGDVYGGSNSANQTATNGASSSAGNTATTDQSNSQNQSTGSGSGCGCGSPPPPPPCGCGSPPPPPPCGCGSGSSNSGSGCSVGCGGSGQAQVSDQNALTGQLAASEATGKQNAVNANVPVNIAGGDISGGSNSANQTATNGASSSAGNTATTDQSNNQTQTVGGSSCSLGCGGNGQAQVSGQDAATLQAALSSAKAGQNTVNANVPVNIAGGDISGGSNSANQTSTNGASSSAGNTATTDQSNNQSQTAGGSSCSLGCGGNGQAQISGQGALTAQLAASEASAKQNAVNANVPVNIAGGDISGGSNSANQTSTNGATSSSGNGSSTSQNGGQTQST